MTGKTADEHPPRIVFDDMCGFCTWCAHFAQRHGAFEVVGFSELSPDQKARLPENYETCVHLLTDDAVYSCGKAVEEALRRMTPALDAVFDVLDEVPGYANLRERLYRWGSKHRDWWGKIVRECPPAKDGC